MMRNHFSEDETRVARRCHVLAVGAPVLAAVIWGGVVLGVHLAGRNLLDMKAGSVVGWLNLLLGAAGSVASVLVLYPVDRMKPWIAVAYLVASPLIFTASTVVMVVLISLLNYL